MFAWTPLTLSYLVGSMLAWTLVPGNVASLAVHASMDPTNLLRDKGMFLLQCMKGVYAMPQPVMDKRADLPLAARPHSDARARTRKRFKGLAFSLAISTVLVSLLLASPLFTSISQVHAAATLLSQNQPATASSTESAGTPASAAVDGNTGTRWGSAFSDPQWLQVDLGATASISQVVLNWESAYARAYQIQVSSDGTNWSSIYFTTTGAGGTETLNISGTGRYVRMYGSLGVL